MDLLEDQAKFCYIQPNQPSISIPFTRSLFDKISPYQHIQILETKFAGKALIIDNYLMSCEKDEFIYSELIAHTPLFSHPHPKSVLIIGGGNGATAREVLKHENLNQCIMAEIDEMVVEAAKEHLKFSSMAFDNPKLDLHIADGKEFIAQYNSAFDIIIVDDSGTAVSSSLGTKSFYKNAYRALKDDGIIISNCMNLFEQADKAKILLEKVAQSGFKKAGFYFYHNIYFPPGLYSFLLASKEPHPVKNFDPKRVSGKSFRYYNSDIHVAGFACPQFIKNILGDLWTL